MVSRPPCYLRGLECDGEPVRVVKPVWEWNHAAVPEKNRAQHRAWLLHPHRCRYCSWSRGTMTSVLRFPEPLILSSSSWPARIPISR
jgi:hypothetical protein